MSKFYAVKIGRIPGVYSSWNDCKAQTDKFPKAIFKSFSTKEEALNFLSGNRTVETSSVTSTDQKIEISHENIILPIVTTKDYANADKSMLNTSDRLCVVYIDGSKRPSVNHKGMGSYCRYLNSDFYMSQPMTREIASRYEIKEDDYERISSPTMEYICFAEILFRFIQFRVREVDQLIQCSSIQNMSEAKLMRVPQKLDPPLHLLFVSDYIGVKAFTEGSWTPKED